MLKTDGIKDIDMKEKMQEGYIRRVRNILKPKLNGMNSFPVINSRAVSIVVNVAGIIKLTHGELEKMDRKTPKLYTILQGFHFFGDVDRSYVKRSKGG